MKILTEGFNKLFEDILNEDASANNIINLDPYIKAGDENKITISLPFGIPAAEGLYADLGVNEPYWGGWRFDSAGVKEFETTGTLKGYVLTDSDWEEEMSLDKTSNVRPTLENLQEIFSRVGKFKSFDDYPKHIKLFGYTWTKYNYEPDTSDVGYLCDTFIAEDLPYADNLSVEVIRGGYKKASIFTFLQNWLKQNVNKSTKYINFKEDIEYIISSLASAQDSIDEAYSVIADPSNEIITDTNSGMNDLNTASRLIEKVQNIYEDLLKNLNK